MAGEDATKTGEVAANPTPQDDLSGRPEDGQPTEEPKGGVEAEGAKQPIAPAVRPLQFKDQTEAERAYDEAHSTIGRQGQYIGRLEKQVDKLLSAFDQPTAGQTGPDGQIRPEITPIRPVEVKAPTPPEYPDPDKYGGDWTPEYREAVNTFLQKDWPAYTEALVAHQTGKRKSEDDQEATARTAQEESKRIWQAHEVRMDEAAKTDPKIKELYDDNTLPISIVMADLVARSERGPQLLRYLDQHRDEADRLFKLAPTIFVPTGQRDRTGRPVTRPVQQGNVIALAMEIGRIEATLPAVQKISEQPVQTTKAPEPVVPVGGRTGAIEVSDEKVPIEEFVRRRNEAQFGNKGAKARR